MLYILTEWNGKGSGEVTLKTNNKSEAMKARECTLTRREVIKRYGEHNFRVADIKCSTIDSYTSDKAYKEGRVKTSATWY